MHTFTYVCMHANILHMHHTYGIYVRMHVICMQRTMNCRIGTGKVNAG